HRLAGEGFFLAVFQKQNGAAGIYPAPPGYRNLAPLSKKLLPQLEPWFRPYAPLRFFQTPGGEVLALPEMLEPWMRLLDKVLKNKWFGLHAGAFKGQDFIPNHALALHAACSAELPSVEFSREQALRFLKKEVFELPPGAPQKGWALARYRGLNLGWLKLLPNRWNNYLPQERRIRMDLEKGHY
ncbi:MAG: hypothetical protein JNK89_09560, partial [Saprospiraceae bacterium]|nr:hypothetical protein [Saprospiraceae bacterium]